MRISLLIFFVVFLLSSCQANDSIILDLTSASNATSTPTPLPTPTLTPTPKPTPTLTQTPKPTTKITPTTKPTTTITPTPIPTPAKTKPLSTYSNIKDYSNDPNFPTLVNIIENKIIILNSFDNARDYIKFIVPETKSVISFVLNDYDAEDPIAFYALQYGDIYTAGDDVTKMVAYGHFGPGTDNSRVGENILKEFNVIPENFIKLSTGIYTMKIQQGNNIKGFYTIIVSLQ